MISDNVDVPLYSRFIFPGVAVESSGDAAADATTAMAAVRERLGCDAGLTCLEDDGEITVCTARDILGRARMPRGTRAAPQSEWRGLVVLPPIDESVDGKEREIPIEEIELTAGEIVAAGGRVVVVIPLRWAVDEVVVGVAAAAAAAATVVAAAATDMV